MAPRAPSWCRRIGVDSPPHRGVHGHEAIRTSPLLRRVGKVGDEAGPHALVGGPIWWLRRNFAREQGITRQGGKGEQGTAHGHVLGCPV